MATTKKTPPKKPASIDSQIEEELPSMRTGAPDARLNFAIPGSMHKGLKVAAAIQDTTVRMMVITIIDEWLMQHEDLTAFKYSDFEAGYIVHSD